LSYTKIQGNSKYIFSGQQNLTSTFKNVLQQALQTVLYCISEQSKTSLPFPSDAMLQGARIAPSKTDKELLL